MDLLLFPLPLPRHATVGRGTPAPPPVMCLAPGRIRRDGYQPPAA